MVFTLLCLPFYDAYLLARKLSIKFLIASMKPLKNGKPFLKPSEIVLKIVPKAGCDPENCSKTYL
jgi:hypothetical protein